MKASDQVQPAVRDNFNQSLTVLREVADVTMDIEWPDFPWGPSVSAIVGAEGASAFLDLIEAGRVKELRCQKDRRGGYAATLIPAVDYLQAMRLRAPMKKAMAPLFEKFDAIVAPTRASVSYPADNFMIKSCAWACLAACSICSCGVSGAPKAIFSASVRENKNTSCSILDICERSAVKFQSFTSMPSIKMRPLLAL